MDAREFHAPSAGRVVQTPAGYSAFIPAPLPPPLVYSPELVQSLSRADAALSELSGLGRHLPNRHLLISPYLRREAVLSSRIEGTRASLSDLLLDELTDGNGQQGEADVREVRNYVAALEEGLARLPDLPLSLRLVKEIHQRLMKGVRGDKATPGEFRRTQNWIGPPGSTPATAVYVPPPPDALMETLGEWEKFLHLRDRIPDLVQCALMHEKFEAIHPFLDGNGRVGRLLITLFLVERGRLSQPLLYLSAFIETHRDEYYDRLQRVRTEGDWAGWLTFFFRGVEETARDAARQTRSLMDLREKYRDHFKIRPRVLALVDELFVNPYITVGKATRVLNVSDPTARQAVRLLQGAKILEKVPGREWRRVYLARPILEIIQGKQE